MLGRTVETIATAAIVLLVGLYGRLILAGLGRHATVSAAVIALLIVVAIVVLRRDFRAGKDSAARAIVTRDIAYLTALGLLLWAVVAPSRTSEGSALAMIEVAIVFDAFTRLVAGRQAP